MAVRTKRGATRKSVRKVRQPVVWQQVLRRMVLATAVIGLVSGGVYLQQEDTLPIIHVTVEGKFIHVDKEELVAAVAPYVRGSFTSVDVASIRKASEALPWVKQIQVRRVWPDTLHLIVEEQVAIARWGKNSLVNSRGEKFLSPDNQFSAGLARLNGPEKSTALVTQRYQKMRKELQQQGLIIKRLEMDERRAWSMTLNNELKVMLGRANSEQRFKRFLKVYQSALHGYQSQISEMDMRYTNGLSVIWKPGQEPDFNGTV